MRKLKIGLLGYGKMGKEIESIAVERGHEILFKVNTKNPVESINPATVDVVIEFSNPTKVLDHIEWSLENKIPIVVGSTGWYTELKHVQNRFLNQNVSFLHASNFSIGVNAFFQVNKYLAKLMSKFSSYHVAIEETHHLEKLDAPSGTAITIAEGIIENNPNYQNWFCPQSEKYKNTSGLKIEAIRSPNVPGTHSISYQSDVDSIEFKHTAHSRKGFALGAVIAAEWLKDKKGVFTMEDVFSIN